MLYKGGLDGLLEGPTWGAWWTQVRAGSSTCAWRSGTTGRTPVTDHRAHWSRRCVRQNSYGTTMASLPFMEETTWHGTLHSMAWWFDSIGDGHKVDGSFHTTHSSWVATNGSAVPHPGPDVPAPDGCLCDAAVPCGPLKNCCAYKQVCRWWLTGFDFGTLELPFSNAWRVTFSCRATATFLVTTGPLKRR